MKQITNRHTGFTVFLVSFLVVILCQGMQSCSDKADPDNQENAAFPIPYPDGGKIITDRWDGHSGQRTLKYPANRHTELVNFYDNYAAGSNWNRTESGSGETSSIIYLNLSAGYTIDLAPPGGQISDTLLLTLSVADYNGL